MCKRVLNSLCLFFLHVASSDSPNAVIGGAVGGLLSGILVMFILVVLVVAAIRRRPKNVPDPMPDHDYVDPLELPQMNIITSSNIAYSSIIQTQANAAYASSLEMQP